jgi:RNA polymerase-binding transcription factor DksA
MLMAHPAVLKDLIEQYETLHTLHTERDTEETRRRMEDVAYTLCVSTGTRDIDSALLAARRRLGNAVPAQDAALLAT